MKYQVIPKYLHGFYHINRQNAIKLAALILKAQTKDNKEPPFGHFQQIIPDLLPKDLLKSHSVSEWKKVYYIGDINIVLIKQLVLVNYRRIRESNGRELD
jgi:hypothetical protein